jgi:carboxypeptidase T
MQTGQAKLDPYEYHTYQEMTDELNLLAQANSDIMTLESLGTSYEGREVWLVELGYQDIPQENQTALLLMGAHHGNEKPSFETLIYFINHIVEFASKANTDDDGDGLLNEDIIDRYDNDGDGLIDEDPSEDRVREVLNNTRLYVVPMVNPDGVEADSRKNRAPNYGAYGHASEITSYGVNLNRNYAYRWILYYLFPLNYHLAYNSLDSGFNYRGEHPFSAEETQAVKQFVDSHSIDISVSFHSYGEFILYPWMHTSLQTPDEELFRSIGQNISRINEYYLYVGNNYLIPRFGGTIGTSENWLYAEHDILSFTVELCQTRAPTDPMIVEDVCVTHVGVNLYLAERSLSVTFDRFMQKGNEVPELLRYFISI